MTPISATATFQRLIEAECMLGDPVEPARIAELVQWVQGRPADILCYDRLDEAVKVMHQIATP
ncbi:MAG: hypothetical protein KAI39_10655 [Desulfobulbaceae bacterium]|nr:hypothetical protein [Desulfobulbaceae bacterium]